MVFVLRSTARRIFVMDVNWFFFWRIPTVWWRIFGIKRVHIRRTLWSTIRTSGPSWTAGPTRSTWSARTSRTIIIGRVRFMFVNNGFVWRISVRIRRIDSPIRSIGLFDYVCLLWRISWNVIKLGIHIKNILHKSTNLQDNLGYPHKAKACWLWLYCVCLWWCKYHALEVR